MSHNNHNGLSCGYAEQMVSYLYGEADAREKSAFETHLKTCSNCADELANFGVVRRSVLDWRTADFSNLETPAFDFPATEREKDSTIVAISTEPRPWIADFRNLFSFNSSLATAAAILVVCVGAALFAFNFSGKTDVARSEANKNQSQAAISPIIDTIQKPEQASVADDSSKESLPAFDAKTNVPKPIQREKVVNQTEVKVSNYSPKNVAEISPHGVKNTDENIKKTAPLRKKKVPNLNDIEDDEDKSIRLADLFEEIDTK